MAAAVRWSVVLHLNPEAAGSSSKCIWCETVAESFMRNLYAVVTSVEKNKENHS